MSTGSSPPEGQAPTDCEVVRDLLPLYVGGDEEHAERVSLVESHLGTCQGCRLEHDRYDEARAALQRVSGGERGADWPEADQVNLWPAVALALESETPPRGARRPARPGRLGGFAFALCAAVLFTVGLGIAYRLGSQQAPPGSGGIDVPLAASQLGTGGPAPGEDGGTTIVDAHGITGTWDSPAGVLRLSFPVEVYSHRALLVPVTPTGSDVPSRYLQREFVPVGVGHQVRF
jgi:hypothetical protein